MVTAPAFSIAPSLNSGTKSWSYLPNGYLIPNAWWKKSKPCLRDRRRPLPPDLADRGEVLRPVRLDQRALVGVGEPGQRGAEHRDRQLPVGQRLPGFPLARDRGQRRPARRRLPLARVGRVGGELGVDRLLAQHPAADQAVEQGSSAGRCRPRARQAPWTRRGRGQERQVVGQHGHRGERAHVGELVIGPGQGGVEQRPQRRRHQREAFRAPRQARRSGAPPARPAGAASARR